jgi:hypothetical protein
MMRDYQYRVILAGEPRFVGYAESLRDAVLKVRSRQSAETRNMTDPQIEAVMDRLNDNYRWERVSP